MDRFRVLRQRSFRLESRLCGRSGPHRAPNIHIHDLLSIVCNRVSRTSELHRAGSIEQRWSLPLLREGVPIGAILIRRIEVRPFSGQADRSSENLRRSGSHCHRECAAVQGNPGERTLNCAKRWSIRPQRPRCSASSAARRPTCSQCSTPSSRARRGFAGLMTSCCDSTRGTICVCTGSFWSLSCCPRRDQ